MMKEIINYFLNAMKPLVVFMGKIHVPFSRKKITGRDYYNVRDSISIGTVLLTNTYGELSNLFNPSEHKHAGLYVGKINDTEIRYVIEAVGKGVVFTDLVTFMTTKDVIVGVRPKSDIDKEKFNKSIYRIATRLIGKPYDFLFALDDKAYYCFELAAECLNSSDRSLQINPREVAPLKFIFDSKSFLASDRFEVAFNLKG